MPPNDSIEQAERPVVLFTPAPTVVITLPFDPKMTSKAQVDVTLKDALTRAVRILMERYPRHIAVPVVNKLEDMAYKLNYSTHKRSVALFVSPGTTKVLYLDEALEAHILVDSGFRIRDLTTPHPSHVQYYVLLLSGRLSKMYLGDNHRLQLIKSNVFRDREQCSREEHEGGGPCTKPCVCNQSLLDKFLYHMDEALGAILDGHPLPVFVLASEGIADSFSRISRNDRHIAAYIRQYLLETKEEDLLELLQPYLCDWRNIRQEMALKHLDIARESGKLAAGMEEVSKAVRAGNNRLLIVERNFTDSPGLAEADGDPGAFYIRDRVDAIIEKVLERGGRVEWVGEGQLQDQGHIALVR
jgi:hypothetical protein